MNAELLARVKLELERAKADAEMTTEQEWLDFHEGEVEALAWVAGLLESGANNA